MSLNSHQKLMLNKHILLNDLARPQFMELFPSFGHRLILICKYSI